jgi:nitrate reductase NapAB chaperone NapD
VSVTSLLHRYEVLVEDDNGRYFVVLVEAADTTTARQRVGYILDLENARIVGAPVVRQ